MANNIVIIGASGYVGKPTVSHLLKLVDPATVTVATRNPGAAVNDAYRAAGARVIAADLSDVESVKAAFAGAHTVYVIAPGTEVRHTADADAGKDGGIHFVVVALGRDVCWCVPGRVCYP